VAARQLGSTIQRAAQSRVAALSSVAALGLAVGAAAATPNTSSGAAGAPGAPRRRRPQAFLSRPAPPVTPTARPPAASPPATATFARGSARPSMPHRLAEQRPRAVRGTQGRPARRPFELSARGRRQTDLLFVFGLTGIREGCGACHGREPDSHPAGTNRIFGTLGDSRCTMIHSARSLCQPGSYRVEARVSARSLLTPWRRRRSVVSTFEFAGRSAIRRCAA